MKNALASLLCFVALGLRAVGADTLPTVDGLIATHIRGLGGQAALEKLNSRIVKATLELPGLGGGATAEFYAKAPNQFLNVIEVPGFGTVTEGYDGSVAWGMNPMGPATDKTGAELAAFKRRGEFHRDLKLKELYPTMAVKGKAKVGEREAYMIEAKPVDGEAETFYLDAQTGLVLRMDMVHESQGSKLSAELYFEDYREVDGVKMPFVIRQPKPVELKSVVTITEVKHNVPIDAGKFKKPAR